MELAMVKVDLTVMVVATAMIYVMAKAMAIAVTLVMAGESTMVMAAVVVCTTTTAIMTETARDLVRLMTTKLLILKVALKLATYPIGNLL